MSEIRPDPTKDIIGDFRQGKVVIMVDDDEREAEGDFVCAANRAIPEVINFMVTHGRGLICTALSARKVNKIGLAMMPSAMPSTENSPFPTAFTISVDAAQGVTTGISVADRSKTSMLLAEENVTVQDFSSPGHTFPLKAAKGGVLVRAGHTEAGVDLAVLANLPEAAVICEIMNEDGTMARLPQLAEIARRHGLKLGSINDLIEYRRQTEILVSLEAEAVIPTRYGEFRALAYRDKISGSEHLAVVRGKINSDGVTNVRVHSECLTGDIFGSLKCDCGEQLDYSIKYIAENGGVILYMLSHEGRGIGLSNKMKAYELQEQGLDTVEANLKLGFKDDQRSYGIGAQILADMGVRKMNLLTNNPRKISGLKGFGLEVVARIPIEIPHNSNNKKYLETKRDKLGHIIRF